MSLRADTLAGVFVGGAGVRMGRVPKGLLRLPDGRTLLERTLAVIDSALPGAERVLVGAARAYEAVECPVLADAPPGVGPLGGLRALALEAERRGTPRVFAIACDLPRLSVTLLARLDAWTGEAVVPVTDGVRNPLCSRYRAEPLRAACDRVLDSGRRSLQAVLDELGASLHQVPLTGAEAEDLADWDTPEDVAGHGP